MAEVNENNIVKDCLLLLTGTPKTDSVLWHEPGKKLAAGSWERIFVTQELPSAEVNELLKSLTDTGLLVIAGSHEYSLKLNSQVNSKQIVSFAAIPGTAHPSILYSTSFLNGSENRNLPAGTFQSLLGVERSRFESWRERSISRLAPHVTPDLHDSQFFIVLSRTQLPATITEAMLLKPTHGRKPEFAITTKIIKSGNEYSVIKQTAGPSRNHLDHMQKSFEALTGSGFATVVKVNEITKISQGELRFEFINGISLENMLIDSIFRNNRARSKKIIAKFVDCVNAGTLKATALPSGEFTSVLGGAYSQETSVIQPGLIDLNLDNLLFDGNSLHLVDYEWVFDFNIPRDYVLVRAFYYFFMRHSVIIRNKASEKTPIVELGLNFFVPKWFLENYPWFKQGLKNMLETEAAFQQYTIGKSYPQQLHEQTVEYTQPDQ